MKSIFRTALPWAGIVGVALAASVVRYGFVEPPQIAHACEVQTGPWWCSARNLVVQGFLSYGYGYAAVLAALLAVCLGVVALQLYCYEGGALALLVGTLRLVRVQSGGSRFSGDPAASA
jgi:hypothetical protein